MTNKQAIQAIKEHCYFAGSIPQAKEALNTAIKALEKPNIEVVTPEDVAIELGCKTNRTIMSWFHTLTTLEKFGYAICKVEEDSK